MNKNIRQIIKKGKDKSNTRRLVWVYVPHSKLKM